MLNKVQEFAGRQCGLLRGQKVVAGLSGGADSVCLLLVLRQLGFSIQAAHCNFHLRGEESLRDEAFVKDLCTRLGTPLSIAHFDTRTYATAHKMGIEMAARELRYNYFEQLRRDVGAEAICVGHHLDDSVETVLLNLIRGTGIEGMTGIKPRNGFVARPLLCLRRREIEQFLASLQQDYITDSTNSDTSILRNQLRHDILPRLEQMNPGAVANIDRSSRWAMEANRVYQAAIKQTLAQMLGSNGTTIRLDDLDKQPSPESILYEWLTPLGFSPATVATIHSATCEQGKQWTSATHRLVVHQGQLIVAPLEERRPTLLLPETGTYIYDPHTKFTLKQVQGSIVSTDALTACLDADAVKFPLTVRPVQRGDRFRPFGMKGSKLVSDFLTDRKCSLIEKERQLVVADSTGNIIWLVGLRPDGRFCVDKTATQSTLLITQHPTPDIHERSENHQ